MKTPQCVLMLLLVALGAAAFEVPSVKMLPKSQIPAAHADRILSWEGVDNARDLGGVKTLDGRRVRRGLVYRSQAFNDNAVCSWMTAERMEHKLRDGMFRSDFGEACLQRMLARIGTNDLSKSCAAIAAEVASGTNKWEKGPSRGTAESRAKILRETGLRTEIDLRSKEETWGMDGSPLGPTVRWINIPGVHVTVLRRPQGRQTFAKCFRIFLDRNAELRQDGEKHVWLGAGQDAQRQARGVRPGMRLHDGRYRALPRDHAGAGELKSVHLSLAAATGIMLHLNHQGRLGCVLQLCGFFRPGGLNRKRHD